jgi:hypothetical protein
VPFAGDTIVRLGAVQLYAAVEEFLGLTVANEKSVELLLESIQPLLAIINEIVLLTPVVGRNAVSDEVAEDP